MAELKTTTKMRAVMRKYIAEMVKADSGWSAQNRDQGFLLDDVEELERQLDEARKAVEWTPITLDNLPKAGDEMLDYHGYVGALRRAAVSAGYEWLKDHHYLYHRPINPPAPSKEHPLAPMTAEERWP